MQSETVHQFRAGTSGVSTTILLLHELGGDETDLLPVGRALAPGANLLSPRLAPDTNAADLSACVRSLTEKYAIDPACIYALGYANGATLAAKLMLTHPGAIAGGVLLRPGFVTAPEPLPDLQGAHVLMAGGDQRLARLLACAGAAVDVAMPDAEPELTPQDFAMAKQWFAETLG